ncbi:MAG: histidine kinase [Gemmatimonadetes bacterium]|nr:histidine kinase [Gemmatimonadota bacterium]
MTGPAPFPAPPRPRRWGAAALVLWLGVNLLLLSGDFRDAVPPGASGPSAAGALLLALPSSLVMTAAAWLAWRLACRRPIGRPGLAVALALHAAAAVGVAITDVAVRKAERAMLPHYGPAFAPARDAHELVAVVIVYLLLTAIAHAAVYARRYREKRLAELRLRATLARAELERASAELRVLQMQVNPHFLFNALHAVTGLLHTNADAAVRMLARLADLLRGALRGGAMQETTLADELAGLEPFLAIERLRLGGRLEVRYAVEDAARGAFVPHMLLQPLVENAIKHGLAPAGRPGVLEISARREGDRLAVAVRDDGVGLQAAAAAARPGAGIGTANARARLEQLYGAAQEMSVAPAEGGGTVAAVHLPWHTVPLPPLSLRPPADAAAGEMDASPPVSAAGRWIGRTAAAVVFLLVWCVGFLRLHGGLMAGGGSIGTGQALLSAGVNAALETLLAAAAFRLARRAPMFGGHRRSALARHARTAIPIALAITIARAAEAMAFGAPASVVLGPAGLAELAAETAWWLLVYLLASLPAHALEYARRAREKEAAELRLQAELAGAGLRRASAELSALRMRLNPRFLFGSLGDAAELARRDPSAAERLVVRVADVLRGAMTSVAAHEVPLEDELRALEPMLDAACIRREGRLRVEREVDDEALDAFVPHLLLQPLVEAEVGRGAESVAVRAHRAGERLRVEIFGAPCSASEAGEPAVLDTRSWLEQIYGSACAVETASTAGVGRRTVLDLPWHEEPWSAPAAGALP